MYSTVVRKVVSNKLDMKVLPVFDFSRNKAGNRDYILGVLPLVSGETV